MGTHDSDRQVVLVTPETPEMRQVVPDKQELIECGVIAAGIHASLAYHEIRLNASCFCGQGLVEIDVLAVRITPVTAPLESRDGFNRIVHGHLFHDRRNDLTNTIIYYGLF